VLDFVVKFVLSLVLEEVEKDFCWAALGVKYETRFAYVYK
jgi:hypothetical protein